MSKSPHSPYWSANANIPIYLEASAEQKQPHHNETSDESICPTCETSSRDQPIHCISVSSPSPPSYHSITPPVPLSSRNLSVPVLNLETSRRWSKPSPPRPALQFDPEGRPAMRFRRNAFSPLSPQIRNIEDIDWGRKSQDGLGIPEAPFKPDTSPTTPATAEQRGEERDPDPQEASNWAQRIEQRLWKYSASSNVVKRWLLEIISWAVSALCMAGIIIMLMIYKDDGIPTWPLGLTLNAYISVLSKIASAALLLPVSEALGQLKWSWFQGDNSKKMWDFEIFDNASRGPWGSLLLLVRTKGRSLAALGAAVTLFALALDPFFQQVVEYPEKWRQQAGNGSIPIATGYQPFLSGMTYRVSHENIEPDQNLVGLSYRFFYDQGATPTTFGRGIRAEVPLACPSSNCTWPEYESFGICSKCTEAVEQVEFKCVSSQLDWTQAPITDSTDDIIGYPNGTNCGWFLKADVPVLMSGYNIDKNTNFSGEVLLGRAEPLLDIFTRDPIPGYKSNLGYVRNPLAHAIIVSGQNLDNIYQNKTPIANECMLSWCAKKIQSSYSEGGYIEHITNTLLNTTKGPHPWQTRKTLDDNGNQIGTYYEYLENVTLRGENAEYFVDEYTHTLTLSLFDDVFPSYYSLINSTDEADAFLRFKMYITRGPFTRNMTHNPFMFNNISTHLDKLANAMTNLMRSAQTNTRMIEGTAFDKENFVDVRWPWLALPLGLLGLTFILLVGTVIRSSMEQEYVGVWKTSAIATLLYGLPDEMQNQIRSSSKEKGTPRAKAKEVKLKWLPKGGWRFSGNGFSPTAARKSRATHHPDW